jgi:RNA polymerase sigma-70 factor (ECF subfamily)
MALVRWVAGEGRYGVVRENLSAIFQKAMLTLEGMSSRLATRHSLIARLPDWADRARWQEFYDTYWRLIHGVARKAGLNDAEAHDVVQETILGVARNITRYDRTRGSFKTWLLQLTRWRILDQIHKRSPANAWCSAADSARTDAIDQLPDPQGETLEAHWDAEWRRTVFEAALARVKRRVSAKHFQIFDCAVRKEWPVSKVAQTLGVNVAQVYLVKHRVTALLKREAAALEAAE